MSETVVETVIEVPRDELWAALDEVDSTGELYRHDDDTTLLDHLKKEGLVEYDEIDCVHFLSGHGWKVYEEGPEGVRNVD